MGTISCRRDDTVFIEHIRSEFKWEDILTPRQSKQLRNLLGSQFDKHYSSFKQSIMISSELNPLDSKKTGTALYYKTSKLIFFGSMVEGRPDGDGVAHFHDYTTYKGSFKEGRPHGPGKLYSSLGEVVQDGQWERGIFLRGKISKVKGAKYVEKVSSHKFKVKYDDESKYEGQGKISGINFVRQGKGELKKKDATYKYDGEWKDNKRHGKGEAIYIYQNTTEKYSGEFRDDKKCGKGKYIFGHPPKSWVEGEWKDDDHFTGQYTQFDRPDKHYPVNQDGVIQAPR